MLAKVLQNRVSLLILVHLLCLLFLINSTPLSDVEPFGTASVELEYLALKEGLYEVGGVKVFDKLSGHYYFLHESFYVWVTQIHET